MPSSNNRLPWPIFVVGAARSGTSFLYTVLSKSPAIWSAYAELHGLYEWDAGLHPDISAGQSNELSEKHANSQVVAHIRENLYAAMGNSEYLSFPSDRLPITSALHKRIWRVLFQALKLPVRIVDKNPKHCFRIGFLKAIFPDAKFLFLYRSPYGNIHSLIEGWESGRFATYDVRSMGCKFDRWSFDLPPGWSEWCNNALPSRCAHQWVGYNRSLLEAEHWLPDSDKYRCYYEDLTTDTHATCVEIFSWLNLPLNGPAQRFALTPKVINSLSRPDADKWKQRESEIVGQKSIFTGVAEEIGYIG